MAVSQAGTGKNESPFWRFSLRFYALPGVAPACLTLQDEGKADVNLMLYLLFLATQKRALTRDDIASLDKTVSVWREEVIKPLRELRRRLKRGISDVDSRANDAFREHVKGIELESERIAHDTLARAAPPLSFRADAASPQDAAQASLDAYGKFLGHLPGEPVQTLLGAFAKL
jgi:uncharacterized protein (TIGR02444 family)